MLNLSEETLLLELEKAAGQDLLAAWVVLGVLMVAGFVGNVVVVVVYGRRFKPSSTRSFILALAVLDLISTGVCIPLEMLSLSHLYTFRWSASCRLGRLLTASVLASFSVLALISVDRCRRVWRSGRQFRLQTVTKSLIGIIVGSHIFMIPSLVVNGINTYDVDVKSENFLVVYRRLQAESAQSGFPGENDTALLNLTGRKCAVNDNFENSPFYKTYINLIMLIGLFDVFVLVCMYGAIGVKAYGVIRRRRKPAIGTSSTDVSSPDVDLEPQSPSKFTTSDAEVRNSDSVSGRYSASNVHGNDEGKASIRHRLSEVRKHPKKRNSASQRRHLSLRPLLQLSDSSEFSTRAWDASRSSSWPRRRGKEIHKSVNDLPGIKQEEPAARERNRGQRKHVRSQSLSSVFHSGMLDPLQQHCKREPSVHLITPGRDITHQDSSDSGEHVFDQDKGSNAKCSGPQMELNRLDPQGNEIQSKSSPSTHDDVIAESGSRGGIQCAGSQSDTDQDQEPRGLPGRVDALARNRQLQLRRKRMTEGSRTTLMLFLVTVTFLVSGVPFVAAKVFELTRPETVNSLHGPSLALLQLGLRSYFLQSAANPILYSLCVPHFRQQCRRLLSAARRR